MTVNFTNLQVYVHELGQVVHTVELSEQEQKVLKMAKILSDSPANESQPIDDKCIVKIIGNLKHALAILSNQKPDEELANIYHLAVKDPDSPYALTISETYEKLLELAKEGKLDHDAVKKVVDDTNEAIHKGLLKEEDVSIPVTQDDITVFINSVAYVSKNASLLSETRKRFEDSEFVTYEENLPDTFAMILKNYVEKDMLPDLKEESLDNLFGAYKFFDSHFFPSNIQDHYTAAIIDETYENGELKDETILVTPFYKDINELATSESFLNAIKDIYSSIRTLPKDLAKALIPMLCKISDRNVKVAFIKIAKKIPVNELTDDRVSKITAIANAMAEKPAELDVIADAIDTGLDLDLLNEVFFNIRCDSIDELREIIDTVKNTTLDERPALVNYLQNIGKINISLLKEYCKVPIDTRNNLTVYGANTWMEKLHFKKRAIGDIPPLPENLFSIIQTMCAHLSGEHTAPSLSLILMPKGLTLNNLMNSVDSHFSHGYNHFPRNIKENLGEVSAGESYWYLITNDAVEGTVISFLDRVRVDLKPEEQRDIVQQKTNNACDIPSLIEITANCALHIASNKIVFKNTTALSRDQLNQTPVCVNSLEPRISIDTWLTLLNQNCAIGAPACQKLNTGRTSD